MVPVAAWSRLRWGDVAVELLCCGGFDRYNHGEFTSMSWDISPINHADHGLKGSLVDTLLETLCSSSNKSGTKAGTLKRIIISGKQMTIGSNKSPN